MNFALTAEREKNEGADALGCEVSFRDIFSSSRFLCLVGRKLRKRKEENNLNDVFINKLKLALAPVL